MPAKNPVIEIAEFDDGTVVFDPRVSVVHLLEDLPAVIFDACDGATPIDELVLEVGEAFGASSDDAREHVEMSLQSFADLGLLEGTEPEEEPPCIGCGGRRSSGYSRIPS